MKPVYINCKSFIAALDNKIGFNKYEYHNLEVELRVTLFWDIIGDNIHRLILETS